jgi:hypothetical protein
MRKPAARNLSTTPSTSGASGPTTVRSILFCCANRAGRPRLGSDSDVFASGLARAAGVAGGDEHLFDPGRLRDFPRQRVFATAAADDEDFQLHLSFSAK